MDKTKGQLAVQFLEKMLQVRKHIEQRLPVEDRIATMLQIQAMKYLQKYPQSSMGALAKELHMSPSAIAQFTDRLVDGEFVVRESDLHDRRVVRLSLTEKGTQQIKLFMKTFFTEAGGVFASLSEKDLEDLNRIFTNLLEHIKHSTIKKS